MIWFRPLLIAILVAICPFAMADEPTTKKPEVKKPTQAELFKKFTESMNNVKMVGRFTMLGKEEGPLAKEEYTILSATKAEDGDKWLLQARIKYGKHDLTVPLFLDIIWSGDTPVITLTDFTIPGLGTFSSRVLIHENSYAGTWTHGKAGGHLFGTIEKNKAEEKPATPDVPEKK